MELMRQRVAVGAAALLGVLAACSASPTLLNENDFEDVHPATQNTNRAVAPGWTWCTSLGPGMYLRGGAVGSWFGLPDGSVGATIVDRRAGSIDAEDLVRLISDRADLCAQDAAARPDDGQTIEPLAGLDDGATGWKTRDGDEWGEYVLIPLDDGRLLTVGFTSTSDDPPIALDDLLVLAEQGAEQFPATD